jgi:hypothetical protein
VGLDDRLAGVGIAVEQDATGKQPTLTVSQVQVWAMRSQAFSSSRTLPGQG